MRREDSPWWSAGFTRGWFEALERADKEAFLDALTDGEIEDFYRDWRVWARDKQLIPEGVWTTWLLNCGRGFGKTRTGAEFIRDCEANGVGRMCLLGQGEDDIREVMIEGESSVLAISPRDHRPVYRPSVGSGRLIWPSGAVAFVYSAMDPEALRGPQFEVAWCDEPMAFPPENRERAIQNLKFGLRLGTRPRLVYTTTPKPHRWIREEMAKARKAAIDKATGAILPMHLRSYIVTEGSTHENRANLPDAFFESVIDDYEGTQMGRQEIYAEILGDEEGALWTPDMLDRCRIVTPDAGAERFEFIQAFARTCDRVVVGVDPNLSSSSKTAHEAGVVVSAKRRDDRFVLEDCSTKGGPARWAAAAVKAFVDYEADEIVAEVNQGGDMVEMTIRQVAKEMGVDVAVRKVRASRGKQRRAEPVATAYDRGMVKHMGAVGTRDRPGPFFKLENQMCALHDALDPTGEDFDRCDAAVWGLTRLGLKKSSGSRASAGVGIRTFDDFKGNFVEEIA